MEYFFHKKSVKRKKGSAILSDVSENDEKEENGQKQEESDPIISDEEVKRQDIRSFKKKGKS